MDVLIDSRKELQERLDNKNNEIKILNQRILEIRKHNQVNTFDFLDIKQDNEINLNKFPHIAENNMVVYGNDQSFRCCNRCNRDNYPFKLKSVITINDNEPFPADNFCKNSH